MEPAEFAAKLISRLESLKREQDTLSSPEERLQQIQEVCNGFGFVFDHERVKLLGFFFQCVSNSMFVFC